MSEPSCSGCQQRDALIATLREQVQALQQRVETLETRLGRNASNSSLPPSANPPAAPPPVTKKRTGRRRGGQPGHPGHARQRLPAERVDHTIVLRPDCCRHCAAPLPTEPSPDDPEPSWHQFIELPRTVAVVTEFQGHARTCLCCQSVTRATIPAEIKANTFGARLTAALSYLAGCQHVSQRGLEEVARTLFGVPVSLGSIAALQRQMNAALEQPHQRLGEEVRAAASKNVDETGWKENGQRRWLWVAVTTTAVYFLVHLRRNSEAFQTLLGADVPGIITSDRWSVYNGVPLARRQLCWAHLKRDFQALVDAGGAAAVVGEPLLVLTAALFDCWYRVRDGTRNRRWLRRQITDWIRPDVQTLLRQGAGCGHAPTARTCVKLLAVEAAMWTFASHEGVEPTNNAAERALRPAVLRRKRSFGSHSAAGCQFVARLLSVVQTLRRRGGQVLDYLTESVQAHRAGLPAPALPAVA